MLAIPAAARSLESLRASAVDFAGSHGRSHRGGRDAPAVLRLFSHREKGLFNTIYLEADIAGQIGHARKDVTSGPHPVSIRINSPAAPPGTSKCRSVVRRGVDRA